VVTPESLEIVYDMIDGFTEEQYEEAMDSVFDAQPFLLQFLVGHSEGWVQAQATTLSFMLFKAYEAEHPGKSIKVERADIDAAFDQAKSWMAYGPVETEPTMLNFITESVTRLFENGIRLSLGEQSDILLLIKTVVLALDQAWGNGHYDNSRQLH
jgi:hypothetical protein